MRVQFWDSQSVKPGILQAVYNSSSKDEVCDQLLSHYETDSTAMELQLRVQKRFADSYFDTTASDLKVQTGSTIYVTIFQYVPVLQINLASQCLLFDH